MIHHTKRHFELHTEIYGSFSVDNCQIELATEDIILLLEVVLIICREDWCTVKRKQLYDFFLKVASFIDYFNAKVTVVAVLQQKTGSCNQVNKVSNKLDVQPSSLLTDMQASDNKTTFALMYLSLLELDTYGFQLHFKLRDEIPNYSKDTLTPAVK